MSDDNDDAYNPIELLDEALGTSAPAADHSSTPAPDPDPAAAPAAGTGPVDDTLVPPSTEPDTATYLYRKVRALAAVAAVVAGVWWLNGHGIPGAAPSPADQLAAQQQTAGTSMLARNAAPSVPGQQRATEDQRVAADYYQQHGSYRGLRLPGARVATSDQLAAISRLDADGACWMYGMRATQATTAEVDKSAVACTDAEIVATQAVFDADDAHTAAGDAAAAEDAFARAAETAVGYALGSWSNGEQSLTGLSGSIADHVRVTGNHGTWVEATFDDGDSCQVATIHVDGTVGDTRTC